MKCWQPRNHSPVQEICFCHPESPSTYPVPQNSLSLHYFVFFVLEFRRNEVTQCFQFSSSSLSSSTSSFLPLHPYFLCFVQGMGPSTQYMISMYSAKELYPLSTPALPLHRATHPQNWLSQTPPPSKALRDPILTALPLTDPAPSTSSYRPRPQHVYSSLLLGCVVVCGCRGGVFCWMNR